MLIMVEKDKRIEWVDTAKGIGILLVILGHTILLPFISVPIYAFHMPLFFLLSGLFIKANKYENKWGGGRNASTSLCIL
jgi:fucose 4-O-acetylase-like acetyltransferase